MMNNHKFAFLGCSANQNLTHLKPISSFGSYIFVGYQVEFFSYYYFFSIGFIAIK